MNVETKTYKKVTPEKSGNLLTTYKDSETIEKYESSVVMYIPNDFDVSSIREVTKEEDSNYKNKRDLYIKSKTN